MLKKNRLEILSIYGFLLSGILFFIANIVDSGELCVAYLSVLCIAAVCYFLNDFIEKLAVFFFFVTFFTFLISGAILPFYVGESDWNGIFSVEEYIVACNILFLSVISFIAGFIILSKCRFRWDKKNISLENFSILRNERYNINKIEELTFWIFCVSSTITIYYHVEKMLYAVANGYMSIYFDFSLPALGTRMLIISKSCMFIGLACRPVKKRMMQYLLISGIVPVMELIVGSRSSFVIHIIFLVFYLISYDAIKLGFVDKRTQKHKILYWGIILAVLAAVLLPFLYSYGYTRADADHNTTGIIDGILNFFLSQGGSFKLVEYAVHYDGTLPGICYSFGTIVDMILGNNYAPYTLDYVYKSNSFGAIMSYLEGSYNYLTLHFATGSSYVAELYYDFGYVGIILANILLGMILQMVSNYKAQSIIIKASIFLLFYSMLSIPRAQFINPLTQLISISNLGIFFVIFFWAYKRKT